MKKIKQAVQSIITNNEQGYKCLKAFLFLASLVYSPLVRLRLGLYRWGILKTRKLPCAVIAIGNITVGGTGKTPTTIKIAQSIQQRGFRVVILSRGYGGTKEKCGGVVSDGYSVSLTAAQAGDEPYLMARLLPRTPVIVCADRYAGGTLAIQRFNPDVILLDDAYQHIKLERDLNFLLMDASMPFGNGYLLPRGPLREPRSAIERSDSLIYTRSEANSSAVSPISTFDTGDRLAFHCRHRTVLRAVIPKGQWKDVFSPGTAIENMATNELSGESFFAFSGLARNRSFWQSLERIGWHLAGTMGFGDHHRYSDTDIDAVNSHAMTSSANFIVTTDKDAVRIPDNAVFQMGVVILGVEIDFGQEERYWKKMWDIWLKHHLSRRRVKPSRLPFNNQFKFDE